ncbi:MAG TPA: hypothetical protein VIA18_03940 [Polyangia bacterium]|jgi:hypothetical protein|nr:hypothetical protein [Polyangia bacterium]
MRTVLAFVIVSCFAGVAGAQQQNPISFDALAKSKAGQWAEYTMSAKGQPQTIKMKYALVAKTAKEAAFEIDSVTPMGPVLLHMTYEPAGADGWKLVKARMQMGPNAQDMPEGQLAAGGIKKGDVFGKLIGTEQVKTAAGSYSCKHYQKPMPADAMSPTPGTIDIWISDKALPTGMVKMVDSQHGAEAVLTSAGGDAKAKMDITAPLPGATPPAAPASSAPAKK